MFRGGPVDSRGTGITSGLMDGGRVGYNQGKLVLCGDLYKDTDYSDFIKTNFPEGRKTEGFAPALLNRMFDSEGNLQEDYTKSGLMGMDLPKAGSYTKYGMPVDSNVGYTPDEGSLTSAGILEAMQSMVLN